MTWALVISPDGAVEVRDEVYDAPWLHETVGGYLEPVLLDGIAIGDSVMMMLNEDGKMQRLEPNPTATVLLGQAGGYPGDIAVGKAVIIAHKATGSEDGPQPCPLPERWLKKVSQLTERVQRAR